MLKRILIDLNGDGVLLLDCYSPSLIPLKPFSRSDDVDASLEIQTFCQQKNETVAPNTDYVNNFYIYPISLNYTSQKILKVSISLQGYL